MTDALTPERILPLLRGRFGHDYRYLESCASTQLELSAGDAEGAVALAEHQNAGRGRLGREWRAPAGSAILLSLLLRPPEHLPLPQLSLVAGIAVARTVEAVSAMTAAIKWPNDVLVANRKLAGVLAEGRGTSVVLGIGLNVNQTAPELPYDTPLAAASLRSLDSRERDRAPLLAELLLQIELAYDSWAESGLGVVHAELAGRNWLLGRQLEAGGTSGVGAGIADDGSLLLRSGGSLRRIASGEVALKP